MKITTLLFLAALPSFTAVAGSAQTRTELDPIVLPALVVSTPRYQPAEQQLNASLKELRQQAVVRTVIAPAFSLLKVAAPRETIIRVAKDTKAVRLAKS